MKWPVLLATALVVGSCGGPAATNTTTPATQAPTTTTATSAPTTAPEESVPTTTPTTTTPSAEEVMAVVAYFLIADSEGGPYLVPVHQEVEGSEGPIGAAIASLLAGPTPEQTEGSPSLSSEVPDGTELLGVDLDDGTVTVDLSSEFEQGGGTASMTARLAQLVFTATRLPEVESLRLHMDGEPVEVFSSEGLILEGTQTRDDYPDVLPPIFVDSPAWGEPVTSPFEVSGVANVFEASFQVLVTDDDGAPLHEETLTASCGTGCWGTFSTRVEYGLDRDQFGAVIVWDHSAEDGARQNVREYPIQLR